MLYDLEIEIFCYRQYLGKGFYYLWYVYLCDRLMNCIINIDG